MEQWRIMNVGIASMDQWIMPYGFSFFARITTPEIGISLYRIKLVATSFERILDKRLLKSGDKFLFLAKYLWYADMVAFRLLGKGLTGASYAAITFGPQLNNYRDLVKPHPRVGYKGCRTPFPGGTAGHSPGG
jgi:hypothetical protein